MLAAVHLFLSYSVPALAYLNPDAVDAINDTSAANAGVAPLLKKLALRAAGAEGVAESIGNEGKLFAANGHQAAQAAIGKPEIPYSVEYRTVNCLDTSGQAFAVWLNVLYLFPLTFLFARFFVRSYLRRAESSSSRPGQTRVTEKAGMNVIKGATRELRNAVNEMHGDGSATSGHSGSSTPHPEAYEANVDSIMTAKQLLVEHKMADIASHPIGVKRAVSSKAGIRTPLDEKAYEANIEDVMTAKQKQVDEDTSRISDKPIGVKLAPTNEAGMSNHVGAGSYEAKVEDMLGENGKLVEDDPEAPTKLDHEGTGTP